MAGGVPFFCVSSPARSAACRLCETDQGSEDFFSSPRIPPAGKNDTERTPAVSNARENTIAPLCEPLAADMESILRKTTRLYPQNQWMHGQKQDGAPTSRKEIDGLFLEFEARALKLVGGRAQSFRNVLVGGEALQIDGVQNRKHVQSDIERSLGI